MTTSFWYFNSIQDGGDKKAPLLEMFHTYLAMMKLGSYNLPKEEPKNVLIT